MHQVNLGFAFWIAEKQEYFSVCSERDDGLFFSFLILDFSHEDLSYLNIFRFDLLVHSGRGNQGNDVSMQGQAHSTNADQQQ